MLHAFSELLSEFFIVELASNGLEAFNKVQENPKSYYDAIILDINMPIMGGVEASNKIHAFLADKNLQALLHLSTDNLPKPDETEEQLILEIDAGPFSEGKNNKVYIYALTGDVSDHALSHIKLGNFDRVLGNLDFNEVQAILQEIKSAKIKMISNIRLKEMSKFKDKI